MKRLRIVPASQLELRHDVKAKKIGPSFFAPHYFAVITKNFNGAMIDELRLVDRVRKVISRGPLFWFTPQEIIRELLEEDGELFSDSSITARCRDLRKPEFGGYTVNQRRRAGSRAHEYQLELPVERQEAA